MHILLAPAKTMIRDVTQDKAVATTLPVFQSRADELARQMADYSPTELAKMLKVSPAIASEAFADYRNFPIADTRRPAAEIYNGIVFKHLDFASLDPDSKLWANSRISICSFLYGLLRPLDLINSYRMEGFLRLPVTDPATVAESWRALLTDRLIEAASADGGLLLNLESNEMKGMFDWKRVESSLRVVTPTFRVGVLGRLKSITVYAKTCRGAMARYVIDKRIKNVGDLGDFTVFGFRLMETDGDTLHFVNQL